MNEGKVANLKGKEGEEIVHQFLKKNLTSEKNWEIYKQPRLNGSIPDFICLNPQVGILVLEVKAWSLKSYKISETEDDARITVKGDNSSYSVLNPLVQLQNYKDDLFEIYCPRLGNNFESLKAITCGVIFPFEKEKNIDNFLSSIGRMQNPHRYLKFCGKESLENNYLKKIFPDFDKNNYMNKETADDLRSWLIEPDYSKEQKEDLELTPSQRNLINNRTETGFRRIRGSAGSGKSIVLVGRAIELAKEKKKVLVVTYNLTLINYLRDICSRLYRGVERNDIIWKNFHKISKDLSFSLGLNKKIKKEYSKFYNDPDYEFTKNDILSQIIPTLIIDRLKTITNNNNLYDAILVDEGQDFDPSWWILLRQLLKPRGEMILAVDTTQNIYDKDQSNWTNNKMIGSGFIGGWSELDVSYRLPPSIIPLLNNFLETFFTADKNLILKPKFKQTEIDFYPCDKKWIQVEKKNIIKESRDQMLSIIKEDNENDRAFTDLNFLCDVEDVGKKLVKELKIKNINILHTYELPNDKYFSQRKRKMAFWKGHATVKATTIHSYKGWEGRFIIIAITKAKTPKDFALIYTALTRIKKHKKNSFIRVICSEANLAKYGKSWMQNTN